MGKRYLVEEIEGEDILETILGGIILIGIIVLINYFIFKSLGKNILRLNDLKTMDPEVLGILIGIFLSTCIGLFVFIYKWIEGYEDSIPLSGKVMLCASAILMILSSIIVPAILYYSVHGTITFEWMNLLKTLILNTILLLIATPLVTLCELIIVVVIGSILSFIIYKTIYFIKSFRIKKTIPWQKILEFNEEENIREHTWYMQVYPEKIEFYDMNRKLQTMISFKRLGYSNLKPLMRLTLID